MTIDNSFEQHTVPLHIVKRPPKIHFNFFILRQNRIFSKKLVFSTVLTKNMPKMGHLTPRCKKTVYMLYLLLINEAQRVLNLRYISKSDLKILAPARRSLGPKKWGLILLKYPERGMFMYNDFENNYSGTNAITNFMYKVYAWMGAALAITAATAYGVYSYTPLFTALVTSKGLFLGLVVLELGLVLALSFS